MSTSKTELFSSHVDFRVCDPMLEDWQRILVYKQISEANHKKPVKAVEGMVASGRTFHMYISVASSLSPTTLRTLVGGRSYTDIIGGYFINVELTLTSGSFVTRVGGIKSSRGSTNSDGSSFREGHANSCNLFICVIYFCISDRWCMLMIDLSTFCKDLISTYSVSSPARTCDSSSSCGRGLQSHLLSHRTNSLVKRWFNILFCDNILLTDAASSTDRTCDSISGSCCSRKGNKNVSNLGSSKTSLFVVSMFDLISFCKRFTHSSFSAERVCDSSSSCGGGCSKKEHTSYGYLCSSQTYQFGNDSNEMRLGLASSYVDLTSSYKDLTSSNEDLTSSNKDLVLTDVARSPPKTSESISGCNGGRSRHGSHRGCSFVGRKRGRSCCLAEQISEVITFAVVVCLLVGVCSASSDRGASLSSRSSSEGSPTDLGSHAQSNHITRSPSIIQLGMLNGTDSGDANQFHKINSNSASLLNKINGTESVYANLNTDLNYFPLDHKTDLKDRQNHSVEVVASSPGLSLPYPSLQSDDRANSGLPRSTHAVGQAAYLSGTTLVPARQQDDADFSKIVGLVVPFVCVIILAVILTVTWKLCRKYKCCHNKACLQKLSAFCDNCMSTPYAFQTPGHLKDHGQVSRDSTGMTLISQYPRSSVSQVYRNTASGARQLQKQSKASHYSLGTPSVNVSRHGSSRSNRRSVGYSPTARKNVIGLHSAQQTSRYATSAVQILECDSIDQKESGCTSTDQKDSGCNLIGQQNLGHTLIGRHDLECASVDQ